MSSRVTRSQAKKATGVTEPSTFNPGPSSTSPPADLGPQLATRQTRKRKASASGNSAIDHPEDQPEVQSQRRPSKRTKTARQEASAEQAFSPGPKEARKVRNRQTMSDKVPDPATPLDSGSNRRKSGRAKRGSHSQEQVGPGPSTVSAPSRRLRRSETNVKDTPAIENANPSSARHGSSRKQSRIKAPISDDEESEGQWGDGMGEAEMEALDREALFAHGSRSLHSTLRALSGMASGGSARFRDLLTKLGREDEPSIQLIALQELSETLLVSNEENLAGVFSPDSFVKELIKLMQPSATGEENPEMMLLACRCVANMMEALPQSSANVVYGGTVPVLCQKLFEIHFIDVAEQALSTLEKISIEFPTIIVREGGLTACLTYLDFFATATQRSAVTTAANCCRNIPEESFEIIRDVMPVLRNVLNGSDQRVVEQGCLCVSRIVESFRFKSGKLEQLVSKELLQAILRLLLPGATNIIGPQMHVQFLKVLSYTAKASPILSAELLKMNVVDTLYQTLTGVSPPQEETQDTIRTESVVIMQALIHRPRDQIFETLNVICELLPGLESQSDLLGAGHINLGTPDLDYSISAGSSGRDKVQESTQTRVQLFRGCADEVRRFATILLPTLTDAYTSTVNHNVRHKVLVAQLKMLVNVDTDILRIGLTHVSYASFLASILSQQDHPDLVLLALAAADILLKRLETVYRYLFYREGVISEVEKLVQPDVITIVEPLVPATQPPVSPQSIGSEKRRITRSSHPKPTDSSSDGFGEPIDLSEDEEGEMMLLHEEEEDEGSDDGEDSDMTEDLGTVRVLGTRDVVREQAKRFLETHEANNAGTESRQRAAQILTRMQKLAVEIEEMYPKGSSNNGHNLFKRLASYFSTDPVTSVSSYELSNSNLLGALSGVLSNPSEALRNWARTAFLEVFMTPLAASSSITPFTVLLQKLQDLLSRAEHFEVLTIFQSSADGPRGSAASMLAKQIRLRLTADGDASKVPQHYRHIMVSIHAIATFRALSDYLRPRISLSESTRSRSHKPRSRDDLPKAMAAYAAASGLATPALPSGFLGIGRAPSSQSASGTTAADGEGSIKPSRLLRQRIKPKEVKAEQIDAGMGLPASKDRKQKLSGSRRSSRKQKGTAEAGPPQHLMDPAGEGDSQLPLDPLECADEAHLSEEEDGAFESSLRSLLHGGFAEAGAEVRTPPEPAPVSVEVGSGMKPTAALPDPVRAGVPTLLGVGLPSRLADPSFAGSSPLGIQAAASLSRSMSYAAALQATPQDWHLQFSIDDQVISNETTIYGAVHKLQQAASTSHPHGGFWSSTHQVKFKKIDGPAPVPATLADSRPSSASQVTEERLTKEGNSTTTNILQLLSVLHVINSHPDEILEDEEKKLSFRAIPASTFVNTKLTAKMNRQMEEPLIVASECLPQWSHDLALCYPFLFPFETRHLFVQSTSFGYARLMTRWQASQDTSNMSHRDRYRDDLRPLIGRLQRQKVRIARTKILESSLKVMELYGASPGILEVEYFDEVGTGLGPTLEFFSTVSKEYSLKKMKLWREGDSPIESDYVFSKRGLFPAPLPQIATDSESTKQALRLFKTLGKFVARSMLDSRIIDISVNPIFFRLGKETTDLKPSLAGIRSIDSDLARSLKLLKDYSITRQEVYQQNKKKGAAECARIAKAIRIKGVSVDDLGLDFTLPGYPAIELVPGGSDKAVDINNVDQYLDKVVDFTLGTGVQRQIEAFRDGFSTVFPYRSLGAFTSEELVMLFGRSEEDWSIETLMDSIKADHGFNMDSMSIRNLLHVMSHFDGQQRRDFLQFVTGSPKLPIGGFKSLTPMFTVVCKPSEPPFTSDDYLPSVMTCVNYLKLPNYSSLEIMEERLNKASTEGQGAFHLS